jgi:hypothetical protein
VNVHEVRPAERRKIPRIQRRWTKPTDAT